MDRSKLSAKTLIWKAIIYRVITTLVTILFFQLVYGDFTLSVIGGVSWNIINMLLYYGFDLAWFRIVMINLKTRHERIIEDD